MDPDEDLHPVPATYEIDWTSKGAPCLPDTMIAGD
jgi:hypothetical protein